MQARPPATRAALVRVAFALLLGFVWFQGASADRPASGERSPRFEGIAFREVAHEVGVDFRHEATQVDQRVAHIQAHITAVGASISVTDVDADGWPDLYTTTSASGALNALFHNRGDGTFDEVAAAAGLADLNRAGAFASMGSVWADFDGDGREDVLVYGWGQNRLLRNLGELRFADVTSGSGLERWMNCNAATWFDYDKDGRLDLYVAGYFDEEHDLWALETSRIMHDSFEFARNGGRNYLFHNEGDGTFRDVTTEAGADCTRWTYAAVSADFDRDGWPDLYLANDYGTEELFLNRAGHLERATGIGLEKKSKSGMCVALGDVLNDARPAVFVTNISKTGYLFQGNNLRLSYLAESGLMLEVAEGNVADCGWAWGAQFGDLDDDGHQDLVVANGFISQSRERDYWYQMSKIGLGVGELVEDAANWPPIEDRSLSGYERTRVLFHSGLASARFQEAGEQVGIDDRYDGRAVALADLDRDGDLEVLIANQKGPLLVYRNETERDRHWIGFDLEGARPNTSAIGAEVEVEFARGRQLQVVTAACGFASQNERRLHFGLGAEPGAVTVHVRWPSGREETFTGLALDVAHRLAEEAPDAE